MATADHLRKTKTRRQPTERVIGTCKIVFEAGVCNGKIKQVTTPRYELPNKDFIGDQEPVYRGEKVEIQCQKCGVKRSFLTPAEHR